MVSHVTEVAEGIHRLTNGVANFYLIEVAGKLVLVDAGAPKDWALFTRAALGLGKVVGDLDAVLLTHAHTDHTGFAEQARVTIGARVWIHENDAQTARLLPQVGRQHRAPRAEPCRPRRSMQRPGGPSAIGHHNAL